MPTLFISHASEDKDDFVRPLAEALRKKFDVWYDAYELRIGDSLRMKIDEGLRKAEYGIVVLSPAFFKKKWTQGRTQWSLGLGDFDPQAHSACLASNHPGWSNDTISDFSGTADRRRAVLTLREELSFKVWYGRKHAVKNSSHL